MRKRIRLFPLQTGTAFSSFASPGDTPPFKNKTINGDIKRNISPFYFFEAWFPLFLRNGITLLCGEICILKSTLLQGNKTAWSPRRQSPCPRCAHRKARFSVAGSCTFSLGCSVTLPLHKFRSFGKCARRILEVTLGKSVILPRFITLYRVSIAKRLAGQTEK